MSNKPELPQDNKVDVNSLHRDLEKQLLPTFSNMLYTELREVGAKEFAESIDKLIFSYIVLSKEQIDECDKEVIYQVKRIRDMFLDIESEINTHLLARIKE